MECYICKKEITKGKDHNGSEERKKWEIWKGEEKGNLYGIVINLKIFEKFIASNSSKYPTECNSLRTMLTKIKEFDEEFLKPNREKLEEVVWKFFYKKGKMVPNFIFNGSSSTWKICNSCSSELETQAKPYLFDEIEMERIENKLKEKELYNSPELDLLSSKLSEDERKQYGEENRKIFQEFFENKEKELNNKILAERERERESKTGKDAKDTNWTPWIIGGSIGGVIIVGLIAYFTFRKKGKKVSLKK